MATNGYLTYDNYEPKLFPNMPNWVFNNPFQSYEQVGKGIEEAYQAAQRTQANEITLEESRRKQAALEEARAALKQNPDVLSSGSPEDLDRMLLGPMAQSGDIDNVMKILENRQKRKEQEDYRKVQLEQKKAESEARKEYNQQMMELRTQGLNLQRESLDMRKENRSQRSDGYKDRVVDVITPEGTKEPRKISNADEELRLRSQGYTILENDPIAQRLQLGQLGFTPEQLQMLQKRGMPSAAPTPTPTPGIVGQALDSYQPRNAPRRFRAVPVR